MQQTKRGRTMLDIGEITLRGAHDHGDLTPSRGSSSAILGSLWGTFSAGGGRPEETVAVLLRTTNHLRGHLRWKRTRASCSTAPPATSGGREGRQGPPPRLRSPWEGEWSAELLLHAARAMEIETGAPIELVCQIGDGAQEVGAIGGGERGGCGEYSGEVLFGGD
jgi:hypothetical protein